MRYELKRSRNTPCVSKSSQIQFDLSECFELFGLELLRVKEKGVSLDENRSRCIYVKEYLNSLLGNFASCFFVVC